MADDEIRQRLEKLERTVHELCDLIRGTPDNPEHGLLNRIRKGDVLFHGEDGEWGIVQKVGVIWKSYVWILCTASGGVGMFIMWIIQRLADI